MIQKVNFQVGTKFMYLGNSFPKEYGRTQEVLHLLNINGGISIRSKFLDNDFIHIFELGKYKNSYSSYCYPLDAVLDNGIPMFWENFNFI